MSQIANSEKFPNSPAQPSLSSYQNDDEIDLGQLLSTLLEGKWLILLITFLASFIGGFYAFTSTPIYSTDAVLHIQEKAGGIPALNAEDLLFEQSSEISTEIELIRSRSLLREVVNRLHLDIIAEANYFPLIGEAYARRFQSDGFATPLFNLNKYAWGGEKVQVSRFDVPEVFLDESFTLVAGENGSFTLADPEGKILLTSGQVGINQLINLENNEVIRIYVSQLTARPGTEFQLVKQNSRKTIDSLLGKLSVKEKGKASNVLQISLQGSDRHKIVETVNTIAELYVLKGVEQRSTEAEQMLTFIDEKLPELKAEVSRAERDLNNYRRQQETVDISLEIQSQLENLANLEKSILNLELELTELRKRFTEAHPSVKSIQEQMRQLEAQKAQIEKQLNNLPEKEFEVASLTRDAAISRELYLLMLNNAQELRIAKAGTVGNAVIIDEAEAALKPIKPKKKMILAASLVLGVFLGMMLVLVLKALKQTIRDPDELEKKLGLNVFAAIPHSAWQEQVSKKLNSKKKLKEQDKPSMIAAYAASQESSIEALKSLRTNLQFSLKVAKKCQIIAISGPIPTIGKSFVSVNLAAVLQQIDQKVLLIDGDMRRGYLHKYFAMERTPGLSEALVNAKPLSDCIHATGYNGFDIMPTGKLPPNPAELLNKPMLQTILNKLSDYYQYIIIDTPPILLAADFAILAHHCDAIYAIIRYDTHPLGEIEVMLRRMESSNLKLDGVIFNDLMITQGHYGYHKYRYYNYKYKAST